MTSYVAPDPIIKPYCNSGAQVPPPEGSSTILANQETGFPPLQATPLNAGGVPVDIEQFNGILKFYTNQILALVMGYQFTFDPSISTEWNGYPEGFVLYCASNNSYQRSLINNNTSDFVTTPSYINDGIHWSAVIIDNIFAQNLSTYNQIRMYNTAKTFYTSLATNNSISGNLNFKLPVNFPIGIGQQYISCDGSGQLFFSPVGYQTRDYGNIVGTGAPIPIVSLTLTTGTWDISAIAQNNSFGIILQIWISSDSVTPTPNNYGDNRAAMSTTGGVTLIMGLSIPQYRIQVTTTSEQFYLLCQADIGMTVYGRMSAVFMEP